MRLKEIREDLGISQKKLAELLNVSPSNVYNYENGRTEPSTEMLRNISRCLNVSVDYLIGNEDVSTSIKESYELQTVLSEKEKELIRVYRSLSDNGKNTLLGSAHNIERFDPQVSSVKKA